MKKEFKQLLKKFKHIGYLNYKQVIEDLKKYNSISEKLDYLVIIKKKYYDEYEKVMQSLTHKEHFLYLDDKNRSNIYKTIFGNHNLVTPLSIQEPVYKTYFNDGLNNPEFTYWFLKYQAKELFNYLTNKDDFKSNLNSINLRETFIKSELKAIEDDEIKTKELFLNKEIDVYNRLKNDYYNRKEIITLRILDGNYYKKNIAENIFAIGSHIVQAYYKHILLKPFLIKELNNNSLAFKPQKKQNVKLTYFERISRELNIIAWAFECQFMSASTSVLETPMLHSKGRYLAGSYSITSNIEILKLQDYIEHYTERFENTNNTILVTNELLKIHEKANSILIYFNENLTSNSDIVKEFHSNKPNDFDERQEYFKYHSGKIITKNLNPLHIVFDKDAEHSDWSNANYNYLTDNQELALFCKKIIDFIEKFNIIKSQNIIPTFTKPQLIKKIKTAEKLADETFNYDIKSELFKIKNQSISESHNTELIVKYLSNNINEYHKIRNFYKVSEEQFNFLNSESENKLTDKDRIDFIAMIYISYIEYNPTNAEEIKTKNEALEQLKDIDNLVFETRSAYLKSNLSDRTLKELSKEKEKISVTEKPQQRKYFIDLFETTQLYDKAISILIENKFVLKKEDNTLSWIFNKTDKLKSIPKMLIALYVVLQKKNYILEPETPYVNFLNEFDISMNKGTFSRYKGEILNDYNLKDEKLKKHNVNYKYISLFDNIL